MTDEARSPQDRAMRQRVIADLCQRFQADPDTIRFVKRRGGGNVYGYAVEFWGHAFPTAYFGLTNTVPQRGAHCAFYLLAQRPGGTISMPGAGVTERSGEAMHDDNELSLRLSGSLTPYPFIGAILERDTVIKSLRLTDANGDTLEEDVVDGYALFVSDTDLMNPLTFSLYDSNGLLKQQTIRSF